MTGWWDDAACKGTDTNKFFPERGQMTHQRHRELAAICATCPVQEECLAYALNYPIRDGFWGGKSERQRRAMRSTRETRIATCPDCGREHEINIRRGRRCPNCRARRALAQRKPGRAAEALGQAS